MLTWLQLGPGLASGVMAWLVKPGLGLVSWPGLSPAPSQALDGSAFLRASARPGHYYTGGEIFVHLVSYHRLEVVSDKGPRVLQRLVLQLSNVERQFV